MASRQFRNCCFTLFVDDTTPLNITTHLGGTQHVRYYVYQFERCPDTGRLHAQGFIQFDNPIRMQRLKREILHSQTVHIAARYRNSTSEEARDYCKKEDTREPGTAPIEWGDFKGADQGKRSDLEDAKDALNMGISMRDFRQSFPEVAARYRQYARDVANDREEDQSRFVMRDISVHVFWGQPGVGKTYRVMHEVEHEYGNMAQSYTVEYNDPLWFCGYENQPVLLIDDFSTEWNKVLPITRLLRLLDKYPVRLNVKGGHVYLSARRIYITSNFHPTLWYPAAAPVQIAALMRRLSQIDEVQMPDGDWPQ